MYRALLSVQCNDDQCREVVVGFKSEEHFMEHCDSGFDHIIDDINNALPPERFVDDCIETISAPVDTAPAVIIDH